MANDSNVSTTINASAAQVWDALINPKLVKQYMMGATLTSDFKVGGPITFTGEMQGKPFKDEGKILAFEPNRKLAYTHQSNMGGGLHNVTFELEDNGGKTTVRLLQDGNKDDKARTDSEKNWKMMLDGMKKVVESASGPRAQA